MNRKLKRTAFVFKYNYFINVFSVTCDQFNAPLLNRSINFNHTNLKLWNDSVQSMKFVFYLSCLVPHRENRCMLHRKCSRLQTKLHDPKKPSSWASWQDLEVLWV